MKSGTYKIDFGKAFNDLLSTDASHLIFCYMEYKGGKKV